MRFLGLLHLAALAARCLAEGKPPLYGLSELDLIFPRAGETYPMLAPFPVIYAIQDAPPLYSNEFFISWTIRPCVNCSGYTTDQGHSYDFQGEFGSSPDYSDVAIPDPIPNGTVFLVSNVSTVPPGPWVFRWEFAIKCTCASFAWILCFGYPYDDNVVASITFTVDGKSTTPPSIATTCPAFVGMMSFMGTLARTDYFTAATGADVTDGCPVTVTPSPGEERPCSATLDSAQASSIWNGLGVRVTTPTATSTSTSGSTTSVVITATTSKASTETVAAATSTSHGSSILGNGELSRGLQLTGMLYFVVFSFGLL